MVGIVVTAGLAGINLILGYLNQRATGRIYGNCVICQDTLTENVATLQKCGHHFHKNCLQELIGHNNREITAYNTWREAVATSLKNLHPLFQLLAIIAELHQLDPNQAEVYMNTLREGTWCGATLKCPTCRDPI